MSALLGSLSGSRWLSVRSLLGFGLGVALIALALVVVHPLTVLGLLEQAQPGYVLGAVLINIPITAARAIRADIMVRHFDGRVPFRRMLAIQLVGQTYSALSPAATGDLVRAYYWRRDSGVPLVQGMAVVMFERVYSLGLMGLVAAVLVLLPRHGAWAWGLVAAFLFVGTFLPLLAGRTPASTEEAILKWIGRRRLLRGVGHRVLQGVRELHSICSSPSLLAKTSIATLAIFALSGLQVLCLLKGLDVRVPITQAVAAYTISQVAGIISVLPFGLGPADVAVAGVLAGYGVTLATSASLAVLLRATTTLPLAVATLPAYLLLERGRDPILGSLGRAAARMES